MSLQRAYGLLEIKSVDDDQRVIEGVASTIETDRQGDIVEPKGAQFRLPLPLLWQHRADQPIGKVLDAKVTSSGIKIRAQIAKGVLPSIDEAWALIKAGLVRGLSIGFAPIESARIEGTFGRKFLQWEWLELSAVTIPANAGASITSIKQYDAPHLASFGKGMQRSIHTPGASGSPRNTKMTISEQLTAEKANLQAKTTELETLMSDETTNGGLDADDTIRRDTLITEVKGLTQKVSHLSTLEAAQAANASAIVAGTPAPAGRQKSANVKVVEMPKGTIFTRAALAIAAGRGSRADTIEYAKQFTNTPEVLSYIKSGLWNQKAEPGTAVIQSPGWGGELVNPGNPSVEFVELLMPRTIIGRVTGFDMVPFNTLIIEQTGGSTFGWVGEVNPKPVGELAFEKNTLTNSKVAGIIVLSDELVRLSTPRAEEKARNDMMKQCAKFIDQQFIRVAVSAGASNPASITNGEASPAATGTTAAALRHDLNIALAEFDTANEDEGSDPGLVIVMTPALARGISLLTTSLGVAEFPGMNPQGGTLLGYPVIVSSSVDSGTIVIFKPSEIYLADDGRVTLDASREATLDMAGGSSPTFNLWQNNAVGLRAERWIRWQKKRANGVVAIIDTAAYAPA